MDVVAVSVVVSVTGTYWVTLTHIVGAGGQVSTMVSLKVVVLTISEPGGNGWLLLGPSLRQVTASDSPIRRCRDWEYIVHAIAQI